MNSWRFLQCIRRYRDTRNIFPHLVNGGKYTASILAGVFLSIYRINNTSKNLGLFIAFSTINGFYTGTFRLSLWKCKLAIPPGWLTLLSACTQHADMRSAAFWDIFMDFSLVQPHARHRFLRDITALKSRWPYYLIMILDPILRFNWIFYAIFTHDTQHSSIASFLIGFAEVTRRGMWTLLRVENEHCSNVAQYKASRDVPLPYHLDTGINALTSARVSSDSTAGKQPEDDLALDPSARTATWAGGNENRPPSGKSTGVDVSGSASARPGLSSAATADVVEEGRTPGEDSLRMRKRQRADTIGKRSIVRMLADAHKQDFEKKRKPASTKGGGGSGAGQLDGAVGADEDDDEDDDDDDDLGAIDDGTDDEDETGSMLDERMEVREAEIMLGKGRDGSEI